MRGAGALTVAVIIGQVISLFRTVFTARLLGTEVQGEAMVLGLVTGFFATVMILNTAWQLVQSDHAEDSSFQGSLQGVALLRGFFTAGLLLFGGFILIDRLDLPTLRGPLILSAAVPILEGAIRLDAWRALREQAYRGLVWIEVVGPVISAAAAAIVLPFDRTVWVIAIIAVAGSLARVIASHFVATKPYRLGIHRRHLGEIVRFSWPLIPAGLFFWINTQADKIVILTSEHVDWIPAFDLAALGAYGTVAGILLIPIGPAGKVVRSVVVPALAAVKSTAEDYNAAFRKFIANLLPFLLGFTVGGALGAEPVFLLLLGEEFAEGAAVAPILAGALVVRFARMYAYQGGVAKGNTTPQLVGNLLRLLGLPLGLLALHLEWGLQGLAWSVVAAETISVVGVCSWLEFRRLAAARWLLLALLILLGTLAAALAVDSTLSTINPWIRMAIASVCGVVIGFLSLGIVRAAVRSPLDAPHETGA
ncbi:MAG: oligosaccharide flippase family protein [Phycisphaerales bacterium]|nr:oligosaccharide flippase family protein [Phycisphaerales bacterium]